MSKNQLNPKDIKLAGTGNTLQWGAVVGIAVDTIVSRHDQLNDDTIRTQIQTQLEDPALILTNPGQLSLEEKSAVENLLSSSGSTLKTEQLQQLFDAR